MTTTAGLLHRRRSGGPLHHVPWGSLMRWVVLAGALAALGRLGASSWEEIRIAGVAMLGSQLHLLLAVVVLQAAWAWSLAQISRAALLAVGGRVGRLPALRISMAGFTLSRVIPTGGVAGGIFAAHEFTRLGNPAPVALAGMVVSWAVSISTLAVLVLSGAVVAALAGELPAAALVPAATTLGVLVVAFAALAWAANNQTRRRRVTAPLYRLAGRLGAATPAASWDAPLDAVANHLSDGRRLLPVLGWSLVSWTLDVTSLWLLFLGFDHALPVGDIAVGYGFANLLSALPELTPGWVGVYEAAVSTTYIALGVPAGAAVAAVMTYRLVSFWLPVAVGTIPLLRSLGARRSSLHHDIQESTP